MNRATIKRWLPLLLLGLVLTVTLTIVWRQGITVSAAMRGLYLTVKQAPWLLLLLFALRPPLILPISWLVLLSGMLWGLVAGGAVAVSGMLLSAASSYALARFVLPEREGAVAVTSRLGAWMQRLRRDGFMSVVLMRLTLLPFDLVNFTAAALRVDFRSYFLATILGNTVATLIYASIGASIHIDAFLDSSELPSLHEALDARQLLATLIVLIASLLMARYFRKRSGVAAE